MANRQAQLIIVLGAVLLAVVAASGAVLWSLRSGEEAAVPSTIPESSTVPLDTVGAPATATGFDTAVLRTSRYTTLDQQQITDGSLPVLPPATSGKANPFL